MVSSPRSTLLGIALAFSLGFTGNAQEPAAATGFPADKAAQLDLLLETVVSNDGSPPQIRAPGLVLLIDTPEGRYLRAAGVSRIETQEPMATDERLQIGSNSKSFTTVLLLQLVEEGVLSLDDTLGDWLPEWADKIPNGKDMTIRQFANHTSGLRDYGDEVLTWAVEGTNENLRQYFSPEELVDYAIGAGAPEFRPGEEGKWSYSSTGYILLGMIIEKATGKKLEDIYRERIFAPLRMQSAKQVVDVPVVGEMANGYYWLTPEQRINTTYWSVSQAWAAGGLIMTAEDLLTYIHALSRGRLFANPETLDLMLEFENSALEADVFPYGLGVMDFSTVEGASGFWGHEGQTTGFQSLWLSNPETGVTIIGLSNSASFNAWGLLAIATILKN
ncbi:MAG: beta-lactamase family protein [Rhodobacteraceae bacterium]|nr:beta-lactamase family protein [Paracoccaceae bacterium]